MSDDPVFGETPWSNRIRFSDVGGGFAYVPDSAFVRESVTEADVFAVLGPEDDVEMEDGPLEGFRTVRGTFDVVRAVALLRANGTPSQPEHVFFAHGSSADGCGCCCTPHPADLLDPDFAAFPMRANPMRANPMRANPMRANPLRGNSADPNGPTRSSARPTDRPRWCAAPPASPANQKEATTSAAAASNAGVPPSGPRIVVLDTGLAASGDLSEMWSAVGATAIGSGSDRDVPDSNQDDWLDPCAGHGTFIAGIIERIAPGCSIEVRRVIGPQGDGSESAVVAAIDLVALRKDPPEFLNLSFGGHVWEQAPLLSAAVLRAQQRGVVVVASAGNDGTCRPSYPAAIPGVVSVGAIGPDGPAPFTNYGSWVRSCAPGVDVVSAFFASFDGLEVPSGGRDIDRFRSWAVWSGTSFAAPAVVGALAREVQRSGCTPAEAVARIVDAPWLGRIPGLGTVVNA